MTAFMWKVQRYESTDNYAEGSDKYYRYATGRNFHEGHSHKAPSVWPYVPENMSCSPSGPDDPPVLPQLM